MFYGGDACATIAFIDGEAYGPTFIPAGPQLTAWTPVSQTTTGSGTSADPYSITTVVAAGATGVGLTQVDVYAPGTDAWTTTVTLSNPDGAAVTRVTQARDCYVAESDAGIGQAQPAQATTYCEGTSAALGLVAASAGSSWVEDFYGSVWQDATSGGALPDTWSGDLIDNGQAVSWALDPSATSQSRSWASVLVSGASASQAGGSPNPSIPATGCSSSRPVNCATGDFWHSFTDVSVPARGLPLGFERTYDLANSQVDGPLGYGWHDDLDMSVTQSAGVATVTQENGSVVAFTQQPDGTWAADPHVLAALTCAQDGSCTFTRSDSGLRYGFTPSGVLTTIQSSSGESLQLTYDSGGRLATISQDGAGQLTFAWSGAHLSSVTDPVGRVTGYGYNASGDLITVTAPGGATWTFAYDGGHHLVTMTDPRGHTTVNTFDSSLRVVSQKQPDGGTVTFAYDGDPATATGATTTAVDQHGIQTTYSYANMLLLSRTVSGGGFADTTSYTYDLVTLRLVAVAEGGTNQQSLYDGLGRLVGSVNAAGGTTAYTYDGSSFRRTSVTSPMGVTTSIAYDSHGRAATSTRADGVVTTYHYTDPDHPSDVSSTVTAGRTTTYAYDALGDVTHSAVSDGSSTIVLSDQAFDASGAMFCSVAPARYAASVRCAAQGHTNAGSATTALDAAGRPSIQTDPAGGNTSYTYDANGDPLTVTDQLGRVTTMAYDANGRTTSVTRGAGTSMATTTTTQYDLLAGGSGCPGAGETVYCTSTSDGKRTTVEGFNANGDEATFTRPGNKTRTYTHNGSRLTSQTLEDGSGVSYSYTGGRLTDVSYTDTATPNVSLGYDADGNEVTMVDGTGQTTYEYDTAGRLAAVTSPNGTVRASYDAQGELGTITYPAGEQVQRTYDAAGRLVAVTDWSGRRTAFQLDDNGAVLSTALPDARTIQSTYDVQGDLTARTVPGTSLALGLARDALGRITTATETGLGGPATSAVTYDPLGQLSAVGAVANSSDTAGDPTTVNGAAQTFDSTLALTARTAAAANTTFTNTALGQRSSATSTNGAQTNYAYDEESRLTELWSVTGPALVALSATSGVATGGNTVTVTGSGFIAGTKVYFGSRAATTTVTSPTSLTAVVPAGSGAVDVTVRTLVGNSAVVPAGRYTYQHPTITSLSPTSGIAAGGTAVIIHGWNFTGVTSVKFGTKAATYVVNSTEQITATSPSGTTAVTVTVTTSQGASAAGTTTTYTYRAQPIITSITPAAGKTTSGTTVTIKGQNLTGVTSVKFGTKAATGVHVSSSTTATAIAPSGSGVVHVTATSSKGTSTTSTADEYGYGSGPLVYSISTTTVGAAGGTTVTVTGKGFTTASTVKVGTATATRTYVSTTSLKVKIPAGTGVAHIVVSNGSVHSPSIPKDEVTYVRPAVTALSLNHGPTSGGQRITVTGSRFTGATKVLFGTKTGTTLTVASSTSLSVTAPAGTSVVDVEVVTAEGTSLVATADKYTYTTAPIVSTLSRKILRAGGGDTVTVTGWNLSTATDIAFGTVKVPVDAATATTATAQAPRGTGVVTVTAFAGTTASTSPTIQQAVYSDIDDRYSYNGLGQRQATTSADGTVTPQVWDPFADQPAILVNGAIRLVSGPGDLPVEQVDAANAPLYYVHDDRGTTRALLDSSGATAATLAYTPDGQITARTGTTMPVITYAGAVQDRTGLLYAGNRYVDPTSGSFLTVDPAISMTGQPYAYAGGDPLNAVDRQGLWPTIVIGALIGAAVGTIASAVTYAATTNDFSWRGLAGASAGGLVSGAITGGCLGAGGILAGTGGAMACGALGGAAGDIVNQEISKGSVDWTEVAGYGAVGAVGGYAGAKLATLLGQDVTDQALNATSGRWGGLKLSNLWDPGAIASRFYGSAVIAGAIGFEVEANKDNAGDLYRYLICRLGL